jgi:hypothetical protein
VSSGDFGWPAGHEYAEYGPWGYHAKDVGTSAIDLLDSLLKQPDTNAFDALMNMEVDITFIEPAPDDSATSEEGVTGGEIVDLHRTIFRLRAALPFSMGEYGWLFDPQNRMRTTPDRYAELVNAKPEVIVSGGLGQVVQGRDIVRRWWDWRRELGEFTGQGSLEVARTELGNIATKLVIPRQWPRRMEHIAERLGVALV